MRALPLVLSGAAAKQGMALEFLEQAMGSLGASTRGGEKAGARTCRS
jgi:hypothetical protein